MTDQETTSLLRQAERKAGELAVTATSSDGHSVEAEAAVSHAGGGWLVKAWAKVKAAAGVKPQGSAGVEVTKRW